MEVYNSVERIRNGDKEALISLIMDKKDEYYRLAYVYTGNKEDSLDALQDMIVIIYDNIKKLKNPEAFFSWSRTILVNCCKNQLRKRRRVIPINTYDEEEYIENYENRENKIDINKGMEKLNSHQREAIKLRYFLDMDYETIAVLTKTPLGTVKSRISTGLRKLKVIFGGEFQ